VCVCECVHVCVCVCVCMRVCRCVCRCVRACVAHNARTPTSFSLSLWTVLFTAVGDDCASASSGTSSALIGASTGSSSAPRCCCPCLEAAFDRAADAATASFSARPLSHCPSLNHVRMGSIICSPPCSLVEARASGRRPSAQARLHPDGTARNSTKSAQVRHITCLRTFGKHRPRLSRSADIDEGTKWGDASRCARQSTQFVLHSFSAAAEGCTAFFPHPVADPLTKIR